MTHLRKMMLEELERRNYAQTTISSYIRTIEDFARYFRRSPDQLTPVRTVRPSPTTAAGIGTARSVKPTLATVGSKHVARNFCPRVTFIRTP